MPTYEYEVLDKTGSVLATEAFCVPVASRDGVKLEGLRIVADDGSVLKTLEPLRGPTRIRRNPIPQRITFVGHAPSPFDHQRVSMRRLHKYEEKFGGPEFARRLGMNATAAKEVWERPEPKETPQPE